MKKTLPGCILCHSTKSRTLRDSLRYDIKRKVLQCKRCSLIYLEPLPGVSAAYYASKKYRESYGPNLKKTSSAREIFNAYAPFQEPIVKEIKRLLGQNTKILDVGCSTGHFLAALKGKVKTRIGLELGKEEAKFIRQNLDFKVYSDPIEKAKITEGPFDLITSLQVLEHVPNPFGFLRGIAKNLKPKGYLYLELPNVSDILLTVFKIEGYADFYYREPHVYYYSKNTLKDLLKKAGFEGEIKNVQRYNFLNHLNWALTGKPQDDFAMGNSDPILISDRGVDKMIRNDFNKFIKDTDLRYKQLVEKHVLGESLTFLGRRKL